MNVNSGDEFAPAQVPGRFFEYASLFLDAMCEKTSDEPNLKGAGERFAREFPVDPNLDIEDDW